MPSTDHPHAPLRERFFDPAASAAGRVFAQRLLQLLMAQDGSTTRLCEAVAGGPVTLQVPHQAVVASVPEVVRRMLPGGRFIERRVVLSARGRVQMDNLSYIALEGLPADVRRDLEAGLLPIGHLLERMWVRRVFDVTDAEPLRQALWGACGQPDPEATRSYRVLAPQGPSMLITETWRRGMLMGAALD